ncbi:hypothetical protein BH11PLA2_BH11PLA2_26310 [soil metagenome]
MRCLTVLALTGALSTSALAQTSQPPLQATLDRLGLKTEWVSAVPLDGIKDGVATVQVADQRQVFVQTRGGLLAAFDAATGERQWSYRYDFAEKSPFNVAFNDHYVIAFNVMKVIGIQRHSGIVEFTQNLPLTPMAGPAADHDHIYAVMIGNRMAAFELPAALRMPDPKLIKAAAAGGFAAGGRIPPLPSPSDIVAGRYPSTTRNVNPLEDQFDDRKVKLTVESGGGYGSSQRSPSLAVSGSMVPPYKAYDANGKYINSSPSLNAVSSLRQPYHLLDPNSKTTQRTPSLAAIPPSLVSVVESSNLRPRSLMLKMKWIYGSSVPMTYVPLVTRDRIWGFTQTPVAFGLMSESGRMQVDGRLTSEPTAQPAQALDVAYVPQNDGYLTAIDLSGGAARSMRLLWKANVGGYMNQPPVPTKTAIYQPGAHAGIARIDVTTGDVTWRTEPTSDHLVAINNEHLYARDGHGKLFVFDRNGPVDPATKRAQPLATAELGQFRFSASNNRTDRIYLVSDTGLFVCLRDSAPQYAEPMTMAPPRSLPPPPRAAARAPIGEGAAPAPMTPAPPATPAPGTPAPAEPAPTPPVPAPATPPKTS